jgi:hypothetical protein
VHPAPQPFRRRDPAPTTSCEHETDSWQQVRLYKLGTPVGDILNAANNPGYEGDDTLRDLAAGDAIERLRQIRALVCD